MFKEKYINFMIEHYRKIFYISLFLLLLLLPNIYFLKTEFGTKIWFRENDQHLLNLEKFEQTFGNDESSLIVFHSEEGIFTPENLKILNQITEQMWLVHDVVRVESLWNFYHSYALEDEIITETLLDESQIENASYLKAKKDFSTSHNIIENYLVSSDGKTALVFGRMKVQEEILADHKKVVEDLESIVAKFSSEKNILYHLGGPSMSESYKMTSYRDIGVLLPILILFIIFYLYYSYRSIFAIIVPLSVVGASCLATAVLANLLSIKFNSLTFILPSILIAIGIADSVHILNTYYKALEKSSDMVESCKATLNKNIWPIFLTSISTAIGFFSLIPSDIRPISELGLLAGCGTFFALIFSYLIVVPQILFYKMKVKKRSKTNDKNSHNPQTLILKTIYRYRFFISISFFSLLGIFIYLTSQNEVNSNPYKFFKTKHPTYVSNEFVLDKMKGAGGPELIIDSGFKEGAKDPKFLKKVDKFIDWIETIPEVNKVISIIDILKEMNQSLMNGDPAHYKISDKKESIAEEVFLYTMALPRGQDLNNRIDLQNKKIRLSVLWTLQDSKTSLAEIAKIENKAQQMGLSLLVTGKGQLFQRMNSYIVETFFKSMSGALILISLLMMFVFKSVKLGLFSLIPNLSPIIFGAGTLRILEKPIDMGAAIVASVTLGIAVDDTIHFLAHYQKTKDSGKSVMERLEEVFATTGSALLITTIILVSCFGLFMFADLVTNVNFGILCALVLTLALVCDLVVLPALLLLREKNV
ncbi:MMPL family transporter [bacterium]|nr:MMPL family transporter [bacterium]